jgi:hypothetical protein
MSSTLASISRAARIQTHFQADALRARGWTAQEIYVGHAPDGTSADLFITFIGSIRLTNDGMPAGLTRLRRQSELKRGSCNHVPECAT